MTNSPDRITSRTNPYVKELCALAASPAPERFLIEGKHLVDMAFEAGLLLETVSVEAVDYPGVKSTLVSQDVLGKIATSKTPSGILGVACAPKAKGGFASKALLLDRVQDPGNVGTILRSAASFGYATVYLSKGCANPYSPKVVAGSQGAIFRLDLRLNEDLCALSSSLKDGGVEVIASALKGAVPLKEYGKPQGPFALILGNEGQGIGADLLALSTSRVKIEIEGMESLNVGVAAGILMYCL